MYKKCSAESGNNLHNGAREKRGGRGKITNIRMRKWDGNTRETAEKGKQETAEERA